jgi:hypothetical protein
MDPARIPSYSSLMPNNSPKTSAVSTSRPTHPARHRLARPALVLAAALLAPAAAWASAPEPAHVRAQAARTLNVTDTAHLRYRGTSGSSLIEEGTASGGLPGTVKVHFNVGASVSATFTISTPRGTLVGHGSGSLHSSGLYASFGGSMVVTSGTGRYRHAHGRGGFYGVINRKTYALTVQTTGKLSY